MYIVYVCMNVVKFILRNKIYFIKIKTIIVYNFFNI